MNVGLRLLLGGLAILTWAIWLSPMLSHQLLQMRALRSTTISIPTLELAWNDLESRNITIFTSDEERQAIELETAAIEEMSLLEERLISAIWSEIPDPLKPEVLAKVRGKHEPPAVFDPRYVDPFAPALIKAVIEQYGYRRISAPLPDVRSASSVHSRPERLQSARLLIEDKALGADSAARILDATLRLTMAQRRRVERERELSNQLPKQLRDLAAKMHGKGQHLQR